MRTLRTNGSRKRFTAHDTVILFPHFFFHVFLFFPFFHFPSSFSFSFFFTAARADAKTRKNRREGFIVKNDVFAFVKFFLLLGTGIGPLEGDPALHHHHHPFSATLEVSSQFLWSVLSRVRVIADLAGSSLHGRGLPFDADFG